jgi:FkbM family methyltransferase
VEIAAVEPLPENVRVLRQTIARNRLNAKLFPAAAGLENGRMRLYVGNAEDTSSLLDRYGLSTGSIEIQTLSVDRILQEMQWDSFDILKIDIEGYERHLFGASPDWLSKVRYIVGELHDGYDIPRLQADIGRYGFRCEALSSNAESHMILFRAVKNA